MKFARNLVLALFFCMLSGQLDAQLYPMPGSKTEAPVLCAACLGANSSGQPNAGLPTYPYGPPLVDHVGRYVDSQLTPNFQHIGLRTARARAIRVYPQTQGQAPPRVYIQIGNALGAYALDTFFTTKLPAGPVTVGGVQTGMKVGGFGRNPLEKITMWDGFMYPEATASGWYAPLIDQQDPMAKGGPFDVDDRGYIYGSWPSFGWGIARDDGQTTGVHFTKIVQMAGSVTDVDQARYPNTRLDNSGVSAQTIVAVKNGTRYYAIIAGASKEQAIFDVTNPAEPRLMTTYSTADKAMIRYDRSDAVGRVAYVDGKGALHVYSYDGMVNNGVPLISVQPSTRSKFVDVAFDDTGNIWAIESARLVKLTPAGASYVPSDHAPFGAGFGALEAVTAGAGHVAVMGTDTNGRASFDVRLAKIEAGGPREIELDDFFKSYYHGAAVGFAEPGQYTQPFDLQLVKWNGKTYLMYSAEGLGDVFEIQGGDSINAVVRSASFGTVNPNVPSGNVGPFPGDTVTFVATSSNPQASYDVSWDFGNTESGASNNTLEKTGLDVKHQYTGLNTASKVTAPKTVRAITIQDSTISSQVLVTLKLPTPRILAGNLTTPITASTTAPLEVVAGAVFKDASDGSVEGHYGVWTIDGVPTKLKPNQTIPVGAVGQHTLKFEAFYGKYDAAFNSTSPYAAPAINVTYVVKPFRVRLDVPSTVGSNVRFAATADVTTDASIITATQWSVTWSLSGTAAGGVSTNAVVPPLTGSYNVGFVPAFDVPKADVVSGSTVTLQISVDPLGLLGTAKDYPQASASSLLTTPDPLIETAGCGNVGSPCSFTAKSVSGGSLSDWTLLWTLSQGSSVKTSAANPYLPTLVQGAYTIKVKATKTVFEKEATTVGTVQQSLCSPPPSEQSDVTINKIGCSNSCAPNTNIEFAPSYRSYSKQACDTFSWTFGDGTSAQGEVVNHSYSTSGTKNVTFTITNSAGTFSKPATVTITGTPPPPPPPPATCTTPTGISITYSGCTSPTSCRTTDGIKFTALRGTGSLQSCDAVLWTFGDGTNSNSSSPTHTYGAAGTFTVTAVVSNTNGTAPVATRQITIVNAPTGGNCAAAPGPGNFSVTFAGPTSGCAFANGTDCQVGEAIAFTSNNFFYTPASCDSFAWNFGDGQTSTERHPAHTYATNGTYTAKLTVTNNLGSFEYTRGLTVVGGAPAKPVPVISITTFPTTGHKGKAITFVATSNMDTTTGWTWNFGDGPADTSQAGTTSKTSTITHTFNSNGPFTVQARGRNSTDAVTAPLSGPAQGQIVITEAPAITEYKYLLPAVAHADGLGSSWRSDVQIYTSEAVSPSEPLKMTASFKGVDYPLEVGTSTYSYTDFLFTIAKRNDQGSVILTTHNAKSPPQIWTRTYNQTENGTFGQLIPAVRLDTAGSGAAFGEGKYYLAGLRHNTRYRTNVGFVNPNQTVLNATVRVFDIDDVLLGSFAVEGLQPYEWRQFPIDSKLTIPNRPFSIEIQVPAGQWLYAYASFLDGGSSDPVFLPAIRESELASSDFRDIIVPGVGHFNSWRSDVTIYNLPGDPINVDLTYYDQGGAKVAEAKNVPVGRGRFLQYDDLLKQGIFSSLNDSFGILRITVPASVASTHFPLAFARTYSDDGSGKTYGQGIAGFAASRANVKASKPALIPAIRNDTKYRTDLNLTNAGDSPAIVTIRLLDPNTGVEFSSSQHALTSYQSFKATDVSLSGRALASVKVEVLGGNVWAYASVIDRTTSDAEYVPAMPLQ